MERDSGGDHHSCRHRTGEMTFQPGDFFFDAGAEPIGPYLVRILVLACGPGRIYGCAVFSDPGNPSRITSRRTYTHTELVALDLEHFRVARDQGDGIRPWLSNAT
jgi:hypothetical protein